MRSLTILILTGVITTACSDSIVELRSVEIAADNLIDRAVEEEGEREIAAPELPAESPVELFTDLPSDLPSESQTPWVIETAEIIRVLEEERIESVRTTHRQTIGIRLVDGRAYSGTYVHAQSGKYSGDEHLADILNLVVHIRDNRPAEDLDGWVIMAE